MELKKALGRTIICMKSFCHFSMRVTKAIWHQKETWQR